MRQLNSLKTPPRVASACPNPSTVRSGSHYINLGSIELGDPADRTLSGRDLRYWLLNHLNTNSGSHRVADLATAITEAGFVITGRASKTISDALHTETDRGRIVRTGWGRYAIAQPLAATTAWRVNRRLVELHRRIHQIVLAAQRLVEQRWQEALAPQGIRSWLTPQPPRRRLQAHIFVAPYKSRQPNGNRPNSANTPRERPPSAPGSATALHTDR